MSDAKETINVNSHKDKDDERNVVVNDKANSKAHYSDMNDNDNNK